MSAATALMVVFGRSNRIFSFHLADDGNVVEGDVSLAPHAVEEVEERREGGTEAIPCKLNDRDVVPELHAWTLPMAQHQS